MLGYNERNQYPDMYMYLPVIIPLYNNTPTLYNNTPTLYNNTPTTIYSRIKS